VGNKMKIKSGEAGIEKQTNKKNTGSEHRGISLLLGLKSRRQRWRTVGGVHPTTRPAAWSNAGLQPVGPAGRKPDKSVLLAGSCCLAPANTV